MAKECNGKVGRRTNWRSRRICADPRTGAYLATGSASLDLERLLGTAVCSHLLRASANGHINKESASEQLVTAIRTVIAGGKYVSPSVAHILIGDRSSDADKPLHGGLSKREFQIFYRLATGESVSKIAEELFLSVKTVSTYRARVLENMQMSNNADLTYYAVKNNVMA